MISTSNAWIRRALTVAAGLFTVVAIVPTPAFAANDSFTVSTTDGCGAVDFVDRGPGAPGGGDNDDYLVIHDYCGDGHGVRAAVWIMGEYWGDRYNGNGAAGAAVIYDPFKEWGGSGNLRAGDFFTIEACLVDGAGDETGAKCRSKSHTMIDGFA